MKKRKASIRILTVLLAAVQIFCCLTLVGCNSGKDPANSDGRFLGVTLTSPNEFVELRDGKKQSTSDVNLELRFNGLEVPYESTEMRYYLPYSGDSWSGALTCRDGYTLVMFESPAAVSPSAAIKAGEEYTLYAFSDDQYIPYRIVFTSFAMMSINLNEEPENPEDPIPEEEVGAMVSFYNPSAADTGEPEFIECGARLRVRGGTSRVFVKKSYKLEFLNKNGDTQNIKLLDLRKDDDWVLYAMYQEETKMRDKLAMDLWAELGANSYNNGGVFNGTRIRYIEIIINGRYWGMYGLMERIDAKQLGLEDDQALLKLSAVYGGSMPKPSEIEESIEAELDYCNMLELKNPDVGTPGYADAWRDSGEFINLVYYSTDEEFVERIQDYADVDYYLMYHLFVLFEHMGHFKNPYIWEASDGRFYIVPWDFDISLGLDWDGNAPLYHVHKDISNSIVQNELCRRLIENDVDGSIAKIKEMYAEYRKDALNEERLTDYVHELYDYIHNSGAYSRNKLRWPDTGDTANEGRDGMDYLLEQISGRLSLMDKYIAELGTEPKE